ncbi:glycosyl hydrolase family 99 protein [Nitzschia inconspicua]|uniref:Glycosyl hydrolase family 99 protein n=1 Tax=Nitzschia inconspicua TaxID=303405 RepID=A0A9K3LJD3_9STRA|nr:glycosyl hydrolase family 99 protein [Nitzschia inconspicua]
MKPLSILSVSFTGCFLWQVGLVKATLNRPADDVLAAESITRPPEDLKAKVGCYYYPWHADDFHRGEKYLRDYLVPRQEPTMGEYDDTKPEVIQEHLRMSRQANCRVWISSWFGPGRREDTTMINTVLPTIAMNDPDHRLAIHYETYSRIRRRDTTNAFKLDDVGGVTDIVTHYFTVDGLPAVEGRPETFNDGVKDDFEHFCTNYFNHPNYYHIGGRPVVFLYLSRVLSQNNNPKPGVNDQGENFYWGQFDLLERVILEMKAGAALCGKVPYIVGDHVFGVFRAATHGPAMEMLDAITSYDTYGQMDQDKRELANGYAAEEIDGFMQAQNVWKTEANNRNCGYIPGLTPGFNDRAVRLRKDQTGSEAKSLSRSIRPGAMEGSLLAHLVARSRSLLDVKADFLMAVTSFNEIHEDTQIEPMVVDQMSRALVIAADGTIDDLEAQKVTNVAYHIWNPARTGYLDPAVYTIAEPDTDLTQGLSYEAYYDLYLNILRATTIAPFFATDFQTTPTEVLLAHGAAYTTAPTIEGTRSVVLVRNNDSSPPVLRLNLGAAASLYKFLVVEFTFYSQRSEASELLWVRCIDQQSGTIVSSEKWEFGREYKEHRKAFHAVTECPISTVSGSHNILIDFVYDSIDEKTSMLIDLVRVTGLKEAIDFSITPNPTRAPTKAPTRPPTRAPTKAPTKAPTMAPTRAPTRAPTNAPTPAVTCRDFVVTIKTDSYPGDTAWQLLAANGSVIDSMPANTYTVAGQEYVHSWCLNAGSYTFVLKDDPYWKDGLCCSYAIRGFYRGTLNGVEIFGNAGAQAFDVLNFPFNVV